MAQQEMAAVPAVPWATAGALGERMARAAVALIEALDDGQRARTLHPFTSAARRDWHYVPRTRPGLPLRAMRAPQKKLVWALVDAALGVEGAAKARGVLALEAILHARTSDKAYRDPENYAIALFGEPGRGPWGWRFEGHHLSLNLTLVPNVGIAVTPHFLGANPFSGAVVPDPSHGRLVRVLEQESALAFAIVNGLDDDALRRAVIAVDSPADIVGGPGRELHLREPQGLPLDVMPAEQRNRALALLETFFGHLAPELARPVMDRVREAGIDRLRFAWAGATDPSGLHYYRLHGPTLIVEYDKTDRDHAHSVWHDPTNLFGEDHLRHHRRTAHAGH
ncbi:DUF3500 domain-containing protein [Benzoatithermus flavus]|uniref:DUF3500 domain-containing protein n=1 Tax=Benzoatithermus flavus TaxID=3108223 RepID=A0ABU8XVD7_9PROT